MTGDSTPIEDHLLHPGYYRITRHRNRAQEWTVWRTTGKDWQVVLFCDSYRAGKAYVERQKERVG